jgi:hypothetical protein
MDTDKRLPIFVDPNKQPKPPDRAPEAVVDRAIERGKRIERVGRALYGGDWVGELKTEEWEIGTANRVNPPPATTLVRFPTVTIALPSSGKEAATIARACFRYRAFDEQTGQVIRWLNDLKINDVRILDVSASEFEAWFLKEFSDVSVHQRRKDAVRVALNAGLRPGHGGNLTWKEFGDRVREQSGQQCDDRTIQRDVEELRSSQS